ncbi:hypothetical protein BC332_27677 [Capsicum chinense]|nr:hypothetical protein BC332_27677 [Capsicum chinense]
MMLLKKKKRRRNLPMTVSLDDEIVEEGELVEAREFGNDVFESILDQETVEEEEEEEEIEEFANDVSEPILEEVDVSENMEPPREWTIRLINEVHQHHQVPNQTSGTRARRTPRMRVNTNYNYYSFVVYELEIQEEEEEDDDNYGLMDQDMSEYLETRTYYAPSPAMDIDDDPVIDEEQEVCAICLAEYKDEGEDQMRQRAMELNKAIKMSVGDGRSEKKEMDSFIAHITR